jgi:hypothetical protein
MLPNFSYYLKHFYIFKMAVFWIVVPCSLAEAYRRFREACCVHYREMGISETSKNFYQSTRCNNAEDSHLYTYSRENLKSKTSNTVLRTLIRRIRIDMKWFFKLSYRFTDIDCAGDSVPHTQTSGLAGRFANRAGLQHVQSVATVLSSFVEHKTDFKRERHCNRKTCGQWRGVRCKERPYCT